MISRLDGDQEGWREDILGVKLEMRAIDLVESPKNIFSGSIVVVPPGIIRKVVA